MKNIEKLALLLIVAGALSRLLPLPHNFTAVTGVTIFAAYTIRNPWLAALVPLGAMALGDAVLGWHHTMLFTCAGMLGACFLARQVLTDLTVLRLAATTFLASLLFFVVSNLGVFLEGYYGYSLSGLIACFVAALPFWQTSLIGDFASTAAIFGLFVAGRHLLPSRPANA